MWPSPEDLAFLAAHRLAVGEPRPFDDVGGAVAVPVWAFRHDGVLAGSVWLDSSRPVPPGVRPVTEPPERVDQARAAFGLAPDAPLYAVIQPQLRLWAVEGGWFVDDSRCPLGGRRRHSFRWRFASLADAVRAAVGHLREQCGESGSAVDPRHAEPLYGLSNLNENNDSAPSV